MTHPPPLRYTVALAALISVAAPAWPQAASSPGELRVNRAMRAMAGTSSARRSEARDSASTAAAIPVLDSAIRLGPNDPEGGDLFGSNVDLQGNTAVIGANSADGTLGAAYVFERKNNVWTQQSKLVALDRSPNSEFGENIKIIGSTIAVGAPSDHNGTGAVYIYQKSGDTWVQQAKLVASDATEFSFFADSITLGQDMLVVGADLGFVPGVGPSGTAYVFRRNGTTWTEEVRLQDPHPRFSGGFGAGTAIIDRDTIAIGAGVVFFYKRTTNGWELQPDPLLPASPAEFFGINIDVDGNFMIVGSPFATTSSGAATGAAYLYRRNGNAWTLEARVEPADPTELLFGSRVAISGTSAVVGAAFTDFSLPPSGGSAWVFQRSNNGWATKAKLRPPDSTPFDDFGGYVAIDGSTVLIGAETAPAPAGPEVGAVYVYKLQD